MSESFARFTERVRTAEPRAAVVLGSGLGDVTRDVRELESVSYGDIPGLVPTTVHGHRGRLVLGDWAGCPVLIAFGRLVFGTEIQGSIAGLLVASALGASAFAAIGLLIGARLSSTEVAGGWMNFVQLPMWLLSGSFFSYERFPDWLQLPIKLLPLTAANDALRRIYNEAASLGAVTFELGVLTAWTLIGFAVAMRVFRWQ